ncbi:RNA-directed DNA polymerase [Desulfosporosinus sp. PR]|uniref:RNA-directed DNA polymerase n=1 Tax=Candidatus Desulfosporosinus nitrosoreducens TaxID=3401928 RepID=UPI0027E97B47|nr:RNA-directed DNA polymerase [Desulfosporosinus sp. PR]MDQ7096848.1 RNA-directed DNA polymerase [Desulfosporosinus sp. PR]
MKKYFEFALDNIVKFGDTDIFPFPIENHLFYDKRTEAVDLLLEMYANFGTYINDVSPMFDNMLAAAGYTGFRWATQIDPIWNAYYLGLVLSISEEIEETRIPKEKNNVFSYRIKFDDNEKTIYDTEYGWRKFQEHSLELAKSSDYKYVLLCDISNFYQNVYHHRLENSLAKLNVPEKNIEKNIMDFLQKFSNTKSYGLPIGGQASRILAELLLNRTDKLLRTKEIQFCRFVDDYHIFAKTEQELYSDLLYLSKKLIENEGLSLQKSKTRIITTEEFIQTSIINVEEGENTKNIFAISLKYDPYALTAQEDYEKLKEEIEKLDILTVLSQELNKTRVHTNLMKKVINSLKYLETLKIENAVNALLNNIDILFPVLPNLMILFDNVFEKLTQETQNKMQELIRELINKSSYLMKIELNITYALRILSKMYSDENEITILKVFDSTESELIRRDIILIMAKWNATHWISDMKNRYSSMTAWEKRSFILASYKLGDEGKHWRDHTRFQFNKFDLLYRDWISSRVQIPGWEFPI